METFNSINKSDASDINKSIKIENISSYNVYNIVNKILSAQSFFLLFIYNFTVEVDLVAVQVI